MTRLVWTGPARRALADIVGYYETIDRELAVRIVDAIEAAPAPLLDFPGIGSPTDTSGVRRWRIHRLPFALIYETDRDSVVILDVYHTAQDRALR